MYSSDEINACMTEEELFELWKTKGKRLNFSR